MYIIMLLLLICKLILYYGYNVYEINYFIIFSYCVNLYFCMMRVCFVNINVIYTLASALALF